ncbi:MAG: hypothetical protein IPK82_29160 [Polyangiaceae bacterium]|nr:hypothetical protein [Polyangiaceae bacterium]
MASEAQFDQKGNAIVFEYKPENGVGVDTGASYEVHRFRGQERHSQRYIKRVLYGNSHPLSADKPTHPLNRWHFQVVFDYGEHEVNATPAETMPWTARTDAFSTYRPGFEVRTYRVCRRILLFHHFDELGDAARLVSSTELHHVLNAGVTLLEKVVHRGVRTDLTSSTVAERSLPPLSFLYHQEEPSRFFQSPERGGDIPWGLDGAVYRWIDLKNEGVPGILCRQGGGYTYKENWGNGQFGPWTVETKIPAAIAATFSLDDFDGDGNLNLVGFEGREAGHYKFDRASQAWEGFLPFKGQPRVDFGRAHAQWVDLNADGYADLLIDRGDRLVWVPSLGADGFGAPLEISKPPTLGHAAPGFASDLHNHTFFADMTGDGLVDLVRITSGRVEYWPNLGHGRFGDVVVMEGAPWFDQFGEQDLARLRLVDLTGSGTADLIYIGRGEIRCFYNHNGNLFGPEVRLSNLPVIDRIATAQVVDFLGDGSKCLVWSTPLSAHEGQALQYLRLAGDVPANALVELNNGAGRKTILSYRSSARDYLADKRRGEPWQSRLPRHRLVVASVADVDLIGGGRLATSYSYHDGKFDDAERRVAGFLQVESWDGDLPSSINASENRLFQLTKTFYYGGECQGWNERAARFYQGDTSAAHVPAPTLQAVEDVSTEDQVDAFRSLAGVEWRREIYSVSAPLAQSTHPLRTAELGYVVRCVQPSGINVRAAFTVEQTECLEHEYEGDPNDPRVHHEFLLETGDYGVVTQRVGLTYPRRPSQLSVEPEQQAVIAEFVETSHVHIDLPSRFEVGIDVAEKRVALGGLMPPAGGIFTRASLVQAVSEALSNPTPFHAAWTPTAPTSCVTSLRRHFFWNDDRSGAAPEGQVGDVKLLHHIERAIFPEGSVADLFGGRVTAPMLAQSFYHQDAGFYWTQEPTYHYGDANAFYRLQSETLPDGGTQEYTWDAYHLLVLGTTDAFQNQTSAVADYHLLAASQIQDPNGNVTQVLYDPLGIAAATSIRGVQLNSAGVLHPIGDGDLALYSPIAGLTAGDVLSNPAAALQMAGRFYHLEFGALDPSVDPPRSVLVEREEHLHNGEGETVDSGRLRITVQHVDGFGRPIQTALRVDPGLAITRDNAAQVITDANGKPLLVHSAVRWLKSGWAEFDHRGNLTERYEPFYSTRPAFETDDVLRRAGVSTRVHYDALGRVVREDLPNGTFTTVEYRPFVTRRADANDNVAGSDYQLSRNDLPSSDPEKQALLGTLLHADTPVFVYNDGLGRPFLTRELGLSGTERSSRTRYSAAGLTAEVIDARGIQAFLYRYDMLGRVVYERSADAGERFVLPNARGGPSHLWDGRGAHTVYTYDAGARLIETRVEMPGAPLRTVEQTVFGDAPLATNASGRNVRGRVVMSRDEAGVTRMDGYDLSGAPAAVRRTFVANPQLEVNWAEVTPPELLSTEHVTRRRFDQLGRVTREELPDGTTRTFVYAAQGQLTEVRLTTADGALQNKVIVASAEVNARGQKERLVCAGGLETRWEYNPQTTRLMRATSRKTAAVARTYQDLFYTTDPVGNITRWVDEVQNPGTSVPVISGLGVSSACEFTYDAFYRLTAATGRVHQALLHNDYTSGLDGENPIKGTRHLHLNNGAAVERYTRQYTYDLAGNLTLIAHQGTSLSWSTEMWTSPTSNRTLAKKDVNGIDLTDPESHFDSNGNTLTLPNVRRLFYNHKNQLVRAVITDRSASGLPDDAEIYVYAANGLRVRRITERLVHGQVETTEVSYFDGCEIKRITYAGNTRLLRYTSHLTDGAVRVATLHQWSVDLNARETDNPAEKKLHFLFGNHLGSVSLEVTEDGEVISYEEYFPYGGTSFVAGRSAREVKLKDVRYSGKCRDDSTGLYHYEFRYYSPFIGNWISPDPAGPVDGFNLYRFARNNPIRFVDIAGLGAAMAMEDRRAEQPVQPVGQPPPTSGAPNQRSSTGQPRRSGGSGGAEGRGGGRSGGSTGPTPRPHPPTPPPPNPPPTPPLPTPPPPSVPDTPSEPSVPPPPDRGDSSGGGDSSSDQPTPPDLRPDPWDFPSDTGVPFPMMEGEEEEAPESETPTVLFPEEPPERPCLPELYAVLGLPCDCCRQSAADGSSGAQSGGQGSTQGSAAEGTQASPTGTQATEAAGTAAEPGGTSGTYSTSGESNDDTPHAGASTDGRGNPGSDSNSTQAGGFSGVAPREDGTPFTSPLEDAAREASGAPVAGPDDGVSPIALGRPPEGQKEAPWDWDRIDWSQTDWANVALDAVQAVLDVLGLIPGLGEIADGVNGLISLARGEYVAAGLSFAAMIPFAGWVATGGKFTRTAHRYGDEAVEVASAVVRHGDEAASAVASTVRVGDDAGAAIGPEIGARGAVVLDTNAVTGMFERGQMAIVEAAMAGRQPIIPITAAKEFLRGAPTARTLADRLARGQQLRTWLSVHGGRIGAAAREADVLGSQMAAGRLGRALSVGDARVLLSAEREGLPLLTRDRQLIGVAQAFGLPFLRY